MCSEMYTEVNVLSRMIISILDMTIDNFELFYLHFIEISKHELLMQNNLKTLFSRRLWKQCYG